MIEIKNVEKKFNKSDFNVIDGISFNITDGESIAIVGANGAGKSTLVEIIAGIAEPSKGEVLFSEEKDEDKKTKIGIQFQSGKWPHNSKPSDLISFFVGRKWKSDDYVNSLIDVFEIKHFINKKLNECSGGEQQRFNCLLSMIAKPKLLILDELITGLDLKMQIKLINYFDNLRKTQKLTLLVISHIPEEIEQICSRMIVIKKGKIYNDSLIKDIVKEHKSVRNYLTKFYSMEFE